MAMSMRHKRNVTTICTMHSAQRHLRDKGFQRRRGVPQNTGSIDAVLAIVFTFRSSSLQVSCMQLRFTHGTFPSMG